MYWCFAQQCFLILSKRLIYVLDIIYVTAAFSIALHDLQCLKLLM